MNLLGEGRSRLCLSGQDLPPIKLHRSSQGKGICGDVPPRLPMEQEHDLPPHGTKQAENLEQVTIIEPPHL